MKCAIHNQEATAICAHCGRAVCTACTPVASSQRTACSEACAQALSKEGRAIDTILRRGLKVTRATAYFSIVAGTIFIAFAFYAQWRLPQLRLAHLLAAVMGLTLVIFGVVYLKAAPKDES